MKILLLLLLFITFPSIVYSSTLIFKYPQYITIIDNTSKILYLPQGAANLVSNVSYVYNGSDKIILSSLPANVSFIYHHVITSVSEPLGKRIVIGIMSVSEPFKSRIIMELPYCSNISYINHPCSLLSYNKSDGKTFITFYTNCITIVYCVRIDSIFNNPFLYIGILSTAGVITIIYKIMKGRSNKVEVQTQDIDERDKKIIEAIKVGANNLTKIAEMSSLPRTTVYRRVKKLVKLGIINEIRENGKVRYEIKGEKK
ncbi:winged helix-turn-helix transcriptional regulator [Acidianus sp. HS-5]|uniref:helix-turn-helix transcriptional regulator n=1 Tax=Acidianus sp. HS-5 TaxID=2886040 RepID=UPI001F2760E2|nr:winged helix-turn-helix transcriptional regulator [Acidianus sp. HS-5]BDC18170.1 transcriptional regulator [Acidianus sp. HS-5]